MQLMELDYVETKGCLTFTRKCVNIGKAANRSTGQENYMCSRDFPEDCSQYGCPKLVKMTDPKKMQLRTLGPKELMKLKEIWMTTVRPEGDS